MKNRYRSEFSIPLSGIPLQIKLKTAGLDGSYNEEWLREMNMKEFIYWSKLIFSVSQVFTIFVVRK